MAKIMLVEDDKSLREIYGVRLAAEGYEIISAGDGEEALAMAVKEKPDLILSDVMMPKISGFDMLDIIRATPETKDLKVIMMTALSSEDQRTRGESLGANKYLVKSQVGIEDVVKTVHEVLADVPLPATPKPVEFNTPVATETINTPGPATQTPEPVPQPAPEVVTPAPAPTPSTPEPATAPATSLPQPTAPFADTAPIVEPTAASAPLAPETASQLQSESVAPEPQVTPPSTTFNAPEATTPPNIASAPVMPTTIATPEPVPQPAPEVVTPAPAPTPSTPEPATAPATSLPQPTAPFSTPAPTTSIGERIINPLTPVQDKPDIASLMSQELGNDPSTDATSGIPPTPQV